MTIVAPDDGDVTDPLWAEEVTDAANSWQEVEDVVGKTVAGAFITNAGNPIATTSGTTELDLARHALSGLNLESRYYLFRALVTWTKTVGTDDFDLRLRSNTAVSGTMLSATGVNFTGDLTIGSAVWEFMFLGSSSITSLHLSVIRTAGTGTLSHYGAANGSRAWSMLSDLGANIANVP